MSQVYVKRCDRCGNVAIMPNVPNPPGWHCLADNMHGTLASFDLCPGCLEVTGLRNVITSRVRIRALSEIRDMVETDPDKIPATLDMQQLVEQIEAGEWDHAFAQGDGVELDAIAEGELVDGT